MQWQEVCKHPSLQNLPFTIAAGVREVWICSESGEMEFFQTDGQAQASELVPGFPHRIDLMESS
ncbi:hypothetical protein [Rhabdochromatium marinum]|uniref:hypothetical protein n=1 Tax=Rhabdochromatium marinum TaxID=48729 RepID=UPI0019056BD8|nr:hypothetical protein [Rhabdochromatium marinum]MBK1647341.1 hypothetical protein [Rhabdochromatium marinum]